MKSALLPLFLSMACAALLLACGPAAGVETGTPGAALKTWTDVAFTTDDGLTLRGRLFGQGRTGVVLAHMFPSDQDGWRTFAEEMAREGFTALTFNFRGYPPSQGAREVSHLHRDLEAARRYLVEQRGMQRVFLVGASMGGTAALKVAAGQPVAGVAALSAPQSFRDLEATEAELRRIVVPVLLAASQGDGGAPQAAQALAKAVGGPKDVRIIEGSAHGTDMLRGEHHSDVLRLLLEFLKREQP